jgi:hypothetical protein
MESLAPLRSIAQMLVTLADEAVEEADDPDQIDADMLPTLRTDLDACGDWLQADGAAPAPRLLCAPVAAEYFAKGSDMADWFALLFAAILQCKRA